MQLAGMDTDTYTKEASCILSNLRNRVMRLFCQIPSIDIALINLLRSCMAWPWYTTGWSPDQAAPLLPLSPSAADADADTGLSVGAVQRQPVDIRDDTPSNG